MKELKLRFENPDVAEWALVRLRERGLHPDKYRIRPVAEREPEMFHRGAAINAAAALLGFMGPAQNTDVYSASTTTGGAWIAFNGAIAPTGEAAEDPSREVELILEVPDRDAHKVESILISNHGFPQTEGTPRASQITKL